MHTLSAMQLTHTLLPLGLAGLAAAAFDPAKDSDCLGAGICLSSFKWCANEFDPECYYPDGVSDFWSAGLPHIATLIPDHEFAIDWRNADPDLNVTITWSSFIASPEFAENQGEKTSSVIFSTSTFPNTPRWRGFYVITHVLTLPVDITSNGQTTGTWKFKPYEVLNTFKSDPRPDMSVERAFLFAGSTGNSLSISQPGSGLEEWDSDFSDSFSVASSWDYRLILATRRAAEQERESALAAQQKRWAIGVGVSVGLGVPLLMALTWFVASRRAGKMSSTKVMVEDDK